MMGKAETWSDKVRAFHNKYGVENLDQQSMNWEDVIDDRNRIMSEEIEELSQAWSDLRLYGQDNKLIEFVTKEGIDVIYTIIGTLLTLGVNIELAMQLVHDSNMSKEGGTKGKIKKGDNYKEPNMSVCI